MIQFTLNGEPVSLPEDIDPTTPLLWVVRETLGLTGSKFGCGRGLCGACTMHVGGRALRTCRMRVSSVEGKSVTTIEGLGGNHPVQQAWFDNDVPQCGFCQSGQIMSAAALLETTPNPTDEDIDRAMSGNICRCGTYGRIRKAIHAAAGAVNTWVPGAEDKVSGVAQQEVSE
ncbi:(2Fe-2S)-binding protein [Aurantivibrio plasticivorans]